MNERITTVVDTWFNETICNSPVSRDTEAYNHMVMVKEDLKQRLEAALGTAQPEPAETEPVAAQPAPEAEAAATATPTNEGGSN